MYRPNTSLTFLKFMKKKQNINTFDYKTNSYKAFKKYLACHKQRDEILRNTAISLLTDKTLSNRALAFKKHFFQDYALELAGACGCSDVLPDHMRIKSKKYEQAIIELLLALKEQGMLGNMSNSKLARLLTCILDSKYTRQAMENRLKNKNPDYEFADKIVTDLINQIHKITQ